MIQGGVFRLSFKLSVFLPLCKLATRAQLMAGLTFYFGLRGQKSSVGVGCGIPHKWGWGGESRYVKGKENWNIWCFHPSFGEEKKACLASLGNCAFNQLVCIYLKGREVSKYFKMLLFMSLKWLNVGEGMEIVHCIMEVLTFVSKPIEGTYWKCS